MSKTLRTAAIIVGAVAIGVSTFGVGTAVTAAATSSFTVAGTGLAVASTATVTATVGAGTLLGVSAATLTSIASGLALASSVLAKRPRGSVGGNQTSFKADPSAGIPYAIGRTMVGGNIVYHKAHGKDNQYKSFVTILSGAGPVEQIEALYVEKAPVSFTGTAATGGYANYMWQRTQLGATPEAAALAVPGPADSPAASWGSAHKLSGYAASIWTLKFDKKGKVFAAGTPQPGWLGKWVKVYDPRLDSSYPGGSGACRAGQEATYVWSDNPWLHALTFALGRWQNGQRIIGLGASAAAIDIGAFVEAANIATANGWRAGGVVYSTDAKWDVMKQLAQAGGGQIIMLGAKISCLVNAPRVSLTELHENDIVGEASVAATQPRRSRFNSVVPRYRSEAHDWEIVTGTPVKVAAHIAEDGGERSQEIAYPLVQSFADEEADAPRQIAQLARYDIENAREFGPITLPLKPRWIGYRPGDCVTVKVEELGLVDQTVLITNRTLDPATGIVTLTAMSETHGKHAFALGQVSEPPPTPGVTGDTLNTVPAPAAEAWELAGTEFSDNGTTIPALVVSGACDNANAEAVLFELQPDGSGEWANAGMEPPTIARKEITGITPGTGYLVGVSYRVRGVIGARRVLGPAGAGDFVAGSAQAVPWGGVQSRPSELIDGRIPAALNADGTVRNGKVLASSIADYVLSETKFAPGYEPIRRVASLPSPSGYTGPAVVFLTSDGKLYRYAAGAWTREVAAVDIGGQLADAQVAALAASKITGQLSNEQLASIAAAKISGQLSNDQLAAIAAAKVTGTLTDGQLSAIGAAKVTGQLAGTQIAADQITSTHIVSGSILGGDIAGSTITGTNIMGRTIAAGHIAAGAITAYEIAASSITGNHIMAGTITADNIVGYAITGDRIAGNTITGWNITAGTITGGNIAGGTITAAQILGGTITGDKIAGNTITGDHIVANTITGGKIIAGSVSGDRIQAYTLTADRLVANSITSAQLATANLITATAQISDGVITNAKIGGAIYSNNWSGFPGSGWYIGKDGSAYFNGPVLSRDQVLSSGQANLGYVPVSSISSLYKLTETWIDTGISTAAWMNSNGPLVASATIVASPNVDGAEYGSSNWGCIASILPLTRFYGAATILLRVEVYGTFVHDFNPLLIDWIVYEVT